MRENGSPVDGSDGDRRSPKQCMASPWGNWRTWRISPNGWAIVQSMSGRWQIKLAGSRTARSGGGPARERRVDGASEEGWFEPYPGRHARLTPAATVSTTELVGQIRRFGPGHPSGPTAAESGSSHTTHSETIANQHVPKVGALCLSHFAHAASRPGSREAQSWTGTSRCQDSVTYDVFQSIDT